MPKWKIEPFKEGDDKRTAFSAETMNEIIEMLNSILQSRPGKGMKITKAMGGWVFESNASGSTPVTGSAPTPTTGSVTYISNCLNRYA